MCGICGQYNFKSQAPVHRQVIERMTRSLVHRGPDDEGFYISGPLGLGFRRLSIIDLGGGHQPMSDQDESVWVVFNGEIYNFPELRRELEGFGHVFRTTCDTEVIVHGYKQWGDAVFNRLNGMFGLAIWDVRQRRLILARDPFGIKLVYYRIESGALHFGSEIRAIAAAADRPPEVDPGALNLFLRYRFTPSPYTIFEGIKKLAPGTMLICQNGACTVRRWYKYKPVPFAPMKSDRDAREELTELYKLAVRRHLISDVPVGLLLSGGIDSALLLALMKLNGDSWQTYTVGYGSSYADDELPDAAQTADAFSSRHTAIRLDKSAFELALPQVVSYLEEPIASSSIVPMYFVCQRARQDVKVALMGQGPDELFGGYRRHLGVRYSAAWSSLPGWLRGSLASTIRVLPRNEMLKRGIYSLHISDRPKRYQHILSLLPGDKVDAMFPDGMLEPDAGDKVLECWRDFGALAEATDELGGLQFLELRSTLPDELLMYADKLSMAHGLEVRVPYLDREIVEYVERLAARFKIRHGSQKWLHRQVSRNLLPATILRRKKRGFGVNVVDDWFRGALGDKLKATFMDSQSEIYRYLRPSAVQELLRQHRSGENDNHKMLFSIVVFAEFLRLHGSGVAAPAAGPRALA
jgi:asparagine synthase (glutamine-hydrolysing)